MSAADKGAARPDGGAAGRPRYLRDLVDRMPPDGDADTVVVTIPVRAGFDGPDADMDPDDDGPDIMMPARAIARGALDAALSADLRARLASNDPIAVVVSVPGADWVDEIRMAFNGVTSEHRYFAHDGSQRRDHVPSKGNLDVGAWLASGTHVVGVSQAPGAFLPSTLLAVADATVDVRAPDGATLARILTLTGRRPPPDIPDTVCSGMSFAEVLAAFRHGFDGAGVVDALKRLAARKALTDDDAGVPPLAKLPGFTGPARDWGTALIHSYHEWLSGVRPWRDVPASAVLAGPPGTGKTYFAQSLAKGLGVPLLTTSVGDWFARTDGNLGDVAKAFQEVWDRAMASRPCALLIDELDSVPDRATLTGRGREWWTPIVTLILTTLDGVQTARDGLVLVGATNYGARLDAGLVRRGRFDRVIDVPLTTSVDDLAAVAAFHVDGARGAAALLPAMRLARNAAAADAAAWAREAVALARSEGRAVTVADVASFVAPPDPRPMRDIRRSAVHEAGHAVVQMAQGGRVESASIVGDPRTGAGGTTTTWLATTVPTNADIDETVVLLLSGRAAEEVLLGAPSMGAEDDLRQATGMIAALHASAGLGFTLLHRAPTPEAIDLLKYDADLRAVVGDHLAALYSGAVALIRVHRDSVECVAEALVARRFLSGDEIAALVGKIAPGGRP